MKITEKTNKEDKMTNKELRKISDKLFREDRKKDFAYKSFCRSVLLNAAIQVGFVVFLIISIILMIS